MVLSRRSRRGFEWVARLVTLAHEAGCRVHLKPNVRHASGMRWLDEYPEC
jgi:hypothetical protein